MSLACRGKDVLNVNLRFSKFFVLPSGFPDAHQTYFAALDHDCAHVPGVPDHSPDHLVSLWLRVLSLGRVELSWEWGER